MTSIFKGATRSSNSANSIKSINSLPRALTTIPTNTPRQRRTITTSAFILGTSCALIGGYAMGALRPPHALAMLYPAPAPGPPSPLSDAGQSHTLALEKEIHQLAHVQALKSDSDWYESRPYAAMEQNRVINTLTAGALRSPGRLAIAPLVHARHDDSEAVVTLHVGRGVCGHDGIVHGGLIATLFDESLARTALLSLPGKTGVTATLNISYRVPVKADQFVVIRSTLEKRDGRKAFVKAELSDLSGKAHAQANALFIEPRWSFLADKKNIRKALGTEKA
ncbi:hypothetical protein E3P92_01941 [Wallemia ichthyophaga]|uniref:Thioesterase domain-containing protein n=2 Tax=Wallemia ichthyophaga TaxID=245174 RepID=A0A4T0I928_WALIC|nr:UPF0644 protein PB2B4.06 [Wallemia ichthyophaga EXF-994]TIA72850.1 hypothetical protein E3P91_01748 [Wallemia ichthyophaga]EOR02737.1 UPF0644 protein PB2B4.06 [Wallemia ichthyophaga EXF-994]TIA91508.1 hypothetical protein E3P97_01966 [Wallemia ichthyophaga]TIB00468.1 hypothetical protein E3P95_01677 [Wallemia ichthyophaga]TIB01654.1 hypothetical protein E3P94_01712 [Wallemia ichthyophaga]